MVIQGLNCDTTDGRYSVFILEYWRSWLKIILDVDALWEFVSQAGKVDACTIMRDAAGRSRCFAFLTFEEPASVNAVMAREHFFGWGNREFFLSPYLSLTKKLSPTSLSILRSTQKEPSRDKNTNGRRSSSSANWQAASLPRACASFFPSSGK